MIELYIYRDSQASSLTEAMNDGSIRHVGQYDEDALYDVKSAITVTADCLDGDETIVFVEVSVDNK